MQRVQALLFRRLTLTVLNCPDDCSSRPRQLPTNLIRNGETPLTRKSLSLLRLLACSDTQYLKTVVVADGNPVRLRRRPLNLVNFARSCVRQDRIFDRSRHLLNVPDQRLMIVRCTG